MKEKKSVGYIIGTITGVVFWLCLMAVCIALTIKFIFWII